MVARNISEKDEEALRGIVKYCDSAMKHLEQFGGTYEDFLRSLALQEACSFDAIQIGESANRLTDEYKENHPDMPWHQIIALRNAVAHAYGDIDLGILWETLTEDFPALRTYCLKELGE